MTDGMADQLPDEPTGTTIDGTPWEEPRPPHLPDTVTGLPVPTILFTLGAIVVGFLTIRDRLPDAGAGPGGPIVWVLSLSIPVVSFLIPAVFFLRHRDAWSAHRAMALGTAFLAVSRVLQMLNGYLGEWFDSIVPPSPLGINPLSVAMQVAVSLAAILALTLMARGLLQARLYADGSGMRRWWALIAIVAIAASLMAFTQFGSLSTDVADETFSELYWLTLLGVILNVATLLAWAYLTGQAIAGRRAREDPNLGWFLAAFSGACILALFLVSGITTVMVSLAETNPPGDVSTLAVVLPAVGYLSLLAAFALRLPTTHAPLDEADPTEATTTPDDLASSTA